MQAAKSLGNVCTLELEGDFLYLLDQGARKNSGEEYSAARNSS
jgi:hypothetical protein